MFLNHNNNPGIQDPDTQKKPFFVRLWRYFLSGVLITAPTALTLYITWFLITTIDQQVKSLIPTKYYLEKYLSFDIPGFGIIIAFFSFVIIGMLTAGVFGRLLVRVGESLMNRMPFVRGLYNAMKQIFQAVFERDKNSFREVVLLQYPRPGIWCLGFVTGVTKGQVQEETDENMINVFLPTTPNPTSGFLLFVPRRDLITMTMSVEEGIKMVVSAGILTPPYQEPPTQEKL